MKECHYNLGPTWEFATYTVIGVINGKTSRFIAQCGRKEEALAAKASVQVQPGERIVTVYWDDATNETFEMSWGSDPE